MPAGIIAATLLVAATTIDDAIWLIPYCTSSHLPWHTKTIHALLFIMTLELMSIFCALTAFLFQDLILKAGRNDIDEGFILSLTGAVLCWILAIGLYVKKMMKRKRRAEKKKAFEAAQLNADEGVDVDANADEEAVTAANSSSLQVENGGDANSNSNALVSEHTPLVLAEAGDNDNHNDDDDDASSSSSESGNGRDIPTNKPSIKMILSLTLLGALDEISYFPALLVGNVFTPVQLCIGTFLASILILVIVLFFLTKFQPLVEFLDGIPLYAIVGMFAIILTLGLILPL